MKNVFTFREIRAERWEILKSDNVIMVRSGKRRKIAKMVGAFNLTGVCNWRFADTLIGTMCNVDARSNEALNKAINKAIEREQQQTVKL